MKKIYLKKNQINLVTFLIDMWEKKLLFFKIIFFLSLLNIVFFFSNNFNFSLNNDNLYLNEILSKYNISKEDQRNITKKFNNILYDNLISEKVFFNFIKKDKKSKYFYFLFYKIDGKIKKENYNSISFLLPINIDGENFINNYINFVVNKIKIEFKSELKLLIEQIILEHERALQIARIISLENPIIKEKQLGNDDLKFSNNFFLYYEGIKILNIRINQYKLLLEKIDNNNLDYYFVHESLIIKEPYISGIFFYTIPRILLLSLFLYFLFIFYKNLKHKII